MPSDLESGDTLAAPAATPGAAPGSRPGSAPGGLSGVEETLAPNAGSADPTLPVAGQESEIGLTVVDPDVYAERVEITRGGMGRIIAARDRRLGRRVAIKELRDPGEGLRARFEREALLTARLQHPAIVSVHEAGRWPSGEPFIAMKLVPGVALDTVIARARTFDERLALLPHILAVADALAYAHQQRVVHRDLKPANVLVGDFGETVVIDWGLAKDLADLGGDGTESRPPYRASGDATETAAGSVLGTPAYMPVEQALGKAVDERADVYAIGAMLYHVLCGQPPYAGKTAPEVLAAVASGPPPPLSSRQPGVPPDLDALVTRAMAREPADRYPTAKELADDLRRFQTGQLVGAHRYSRRQLLWRWVKRHRGAVAVATIALVTLATVGVVSLRRIFAEQRRTEEARAVAEKNRADAEELVNFVLVDVRDRLETIGQSQLLEDATRTTSEYYATTEIDDANAGHLKLTAFLNLGDLLDTRGDQEGAMAQYRAALSLAEDMFAADPIVPDRFNEMNIAQSRIGNLLKESGDLDGALAAYRRALLIAWMFAAIWPEDLDAIESLAIGHDKVGEVLRRKKDLDGAVDAYQRSLVWRRKLIAREPGTARFRRGIAISNQRLGDVHILRDQPVPAEAYYRASLAGFEELLASEPENLLHRQSHAMAVGKLANAKLGLKDFDAAIGGFSQALKEAEQIAVGDRANLEFQWDVGDAHADLGDAHLSAGDPAMALTEYRLALAIYEPIVKTTTSEVWKRAEARVREKATHIMNGTPIPPPP